MEMSVWIGKVKSEYLSGGFGPEIEELLVQPPRADRTGIADVVYDAVFG
jgi:hypothetical protein